MFSLVLYRVEKCRLDLSLAISEKIGSDQVEWRNVNKKLLNFLMLPLINAGNQQIEQNLG